MDERKRTHWLLPADWPIFVKILVSLVAMVALALVVTTSVNVRMLQGDLREQIGLEFESLAVSQMSSLADILSMNLNFLRSIALAESIRIGAVVGNAGYSGDQAAIQGKLLDLDEQWQASADDSSLIRSIVDPRVNYLVSQLLEYQHASPEHVEIFLTDRYGGLLVSTGRTSDYYQADEGWWRAAYNDGQGGFFVGQPEFDESTGYTVLDMAVPVVSKQGEVIGVAHSTYRMDAIYEAVSRVEIGETGHARVVDSAGVVIADPRVERVGEQMPSTWTRPEMFEEVSRWDELEDKNGVPMLVGRATIAGVEIEQEEEAEAIHSLGWVMYVQQPQKEAYRPVTTATRWGFVAVSVFALVAAGLAFVLARAVVAPITDLVGTARMMAAGDLSVRARVHRRDETGELAETFNSMADEVTAVVGSLERQVAERTADLEQRMAELEELTQNLEQIVDQSRRRALRLEASAQVARAVTSVLDQDALLRRVVDLISDRVGFYHVGIFLLDEGSQNAVLRAASSEAGHQMLARGHHLQVGGQSIVGYVSATGRPRIALDVGKDAVFFDNPDLPQTRSEMALPLTARRRILGVLDIQSLESEAFDQEDVAVLQTLADQIAIALDNAHLFGEAQDALREMRAVQSQYAAQAWWNLQAEEGVRTVEYIRPGVMSLGDQPLPAAVRAVRDGETVVTSGDGAGHVPASLVVPLKQHGQTIGVLGFQETEPGRVWTADEIALAEAAAYEIVQVLEGARLFQDTQQRAWREQTIGQITAQIRANTDVQDIMRTTAEELGRTLGVSRAIVRLGMSEGTLAEERDGDGAAVPSAGEEV